MFSINITGKFLKALFTWHFYDYDVKILEIDFSKIIPNRPESIEIPIIIRVSTITETKEYKFIGGFMFNNPWNNPWKPYWGSKVEAHEVICII